MNLLKLQVIKLTQKSLAFLYTNNKRSEREIKETVPFTIASKRIKYWGINLSKKTKGFPGGSDGTESACKAGGLGWIPGSGRLAGEGMATHSSVLAWRSPWTEEPGGLQSTVSQSDGHNWPINTLFFFKEIKDLYTENYKIMMKEIKDDTNKWRDIPCSWMGRINTVKI